MEDIAHSDTSAQDHSRTVTSVRHDREDAKMSARERSFVKARSSQIMRRDSVMVEYGNADGMLHQKHSLEGIQIDNWRLPEL
ncbi:hypothetical protein LTR53_003652 [Teratosphaeriaceae sp. CCFEE 6253]|nr:hypothetical protein LTR53_003652 [Teratosphaeriaceae sp. CCFEE 6253]